MIDKIYKYVDKNGLERILKDSTIKFSKPNEFNDPFEFHESLVDYEFSDEHWLEIIKKREPNVTNERLKRFKNCL